MFWPYFRFTFLLGTARAAAIIATDRKRNENKLITDVAGTCIMNGVVTPAGWPFFLFLDCRSLEVFLRNKNPRKYRAEFFIFE